MHPFDGHGYLRAFTFDGLNGDKFTVKFMARYVNTEAKVEEHDPVTNTWRFRHRGLFSMLKRGEKVWNTKVMKNVANTSVLSWGGRLLCLWEGGEPYEIEPERLDTIGKVKLMDGWDSVVERRSDGGDVWDVAARLLKPILYGVFKMPVKRLLAHYKFDARRNRLLLMSCNAEDIFLPRTNFTFYGAMTSFCGITPTIAALSVNPSKETSPIYVLPRFPNEVNYNRDWRVPVEAPSQFWLLHVGNAYESLDENGNLEIQIQASVCSYEWFTLHKLLGYDWQSGKLDPSIMYLNGNKSKKMPHLVQVSINLDTDGIYQRCDIEPLNQWIKSSDFPVINPAFSGSKNKYIYAAAFSGSRRALPNFPYDMVVKVNLSTKSVRTWYADSRRFIGEPTFIAKGSEEDEGYILVVEYAVAVQRCYLVILDSKRIGEADALMARLEVPKHLNFPLGFHGFWASNE
ncbi:putative oxidoreductase [Rosa chinensis]|uniref:Putative oxidoreductase n=1 Tax=Rosa chinensis TaxID=74649 RepID=A0A2P6SFH6_ROSCH|nr:putative oxidoreductase [Rosa chinensis]